MKNETFRRYSKELEEDIHELFGQDIKIIKKSSKIVIKMKNEMTPDYIVTRLKLNYMRKSPLYSLLSTLISKSYTSIPEIAYDLNFSEPTVYKLLTQVKEIMLPFKAEFDLANATNFSGDELGVRYFLYLTHWHLFNTLGKKPFSDAFPPEFIDINFLKRSLKIERKLSKAQEQKLLILACVTSYRIVYFKKYVKVEKAFLEDISIFYRGHHCLNLASFNVDPEIIEKESILLSFLVRGLIFEFDDMYEKKRVVERFQNSKLSVGYEVSLFLEKFRETFSFEFSEENYVKSYYLLVLTNLTCGAGASSGFMAAAARKAAKKLGVDVEVKAKSETEVASLLPETDLLLVAPHLKYMIDEVKELCETNNVKYDIIPQRVYGSLDGKGLIEFALKKFETE